MPQGEIIPNGHRDLSASAEIGNKEEKTSAAKKGQGMSACVRRRGYRGGMRKAI